MAEVGWGVESGDTDPSGGATAALIGAVVVEWIAFAVGLAWLAFGWPLVRNLDRPLARPARGGARYRSDPSAGGTAMLGCRSSWARLSGVRGRLK